MTTHWYSRKGANQSFVARTGYPDFVSKFITRFHQVYGQFDTRFALITDETENAILACLCLCDDFDCYYFR